MADNAEQVNAEPAQPPVAPATIEADDQPDETLGSDVASDTTSLKSSVLNFEIENGRRYHAFRKGAYAFPNDEEELDRMDLEHQIFHLLLGGNFLAPLVSPLKILDLGTGTGLWAIEMADKFTEAHVTGTDLSPVQPSAVPPNCEFLVDDFEQDWMWPDNTFDYVHGRLLLASVTNYPNLFQRAFAATKPGGWFEMHEIEPLSYCDDGTLTEKSKSVQWGNLFMEGCAKAGRRILSLDEYRPLMEAAGFTDIQEVRMKRPHNNWPKDKNMKRIGMYTLLNHMNGLQAFTVGIFTRVLGWTPEEVDIFCAECRTEWSSTKRHGYQKVIAIYGRKPPV